MSIFSIGGLFLLPLKYLRGSLGLCLGSLPKLFLSMYMDMCCAGLGNDRPLILRGSGETSTGETDLARLPDESFVAGCSSPPEGVRERASIGVGVAGFIFLPRGVGRRAPATSCEGECSLRGGFGLIFLRVLVLGRVACGVVRSSGV